MKAVRNKMHKHQKFILTPIESILEQVISAAAGVGDGIETYVLLDYVMQSVFIKMTGFQEQKMKCVCWEMATNDYGFRYEYLKNHGSYGEHSSYEAKQLAYKNLRNLSGAKADIDCARKKQILQEVYDKIDQLFTGTGFSICSSSSFKSYKDTLKHITEIDFAEGNTLLADIKNKNKKEDENKGNDKLLKYIYENHLYRHRNRIAHNLLSYQHNLPTFNSLLKENIKYDNYFIYFFILILIDRIFIELYKQYTDNIESSITI